MWVLVQPPCSAAWPNLTATFIRSHANTTVTPLHPQPLEDGIKSLCATLPDEIFLLGILLLEPCISLTYAWKTNKYTNVSALHCHLQGGFLVPSERCSFEKQSIEYCGWACCV